MPRNPGKNITEDEPPCDATTIALTTRSQRRINSAPISSPKGNAEFEKSAQEEEGRNKRESEDEVGRGALRETPGAFLREARVKKKEKRKKRRGARCHRYARSL